MLGVCGNRPSNSDGCFGNENSEKIVKIRTRKIFKNKKRLNGTDVALVICTILLILFVISMIVTFWKFQDIPSELCVTLIPSFMGEYGFCTIIYKSKQKDSDVIGEYSLDGND